VALGSGEGTPALVPATSEPIIPSATPGPTSCEKVGGVCLELTWDGENCTYKGPEEIEAGRVTFLFRNESEEPAWTNMIRLPEDKTLQDVIDYNNQDPTPVARPSWAEEYYDDVYGEVYDWAWHDIHLGRKSETGVPCNGVWYRSAVCGVDGSWADGCRLTRATCGEAWSICTYSTLRQGRIDEELMHGPEAVRY
jgi:hypothetical protein